MKYLKLLAIAGIVAMGMSSAAFAEVLSPYGTSQADLHPYPKLNAVFDANYMDPKDLNVLFAFVNATKAKLKGKMVVVTHGPELRAFAKENYIKYQGVVDKMKKLADSGVEFRMCYNALRAAGYEKMIFMASSKSYRRVFRRSPYCNRRASNISIPWRTGSVAPATGIVRS